MDNRFNQKSPLLSHQQTRTHANSISNVHQVWLSSAVCWRDCWNRGLIDGVWVNHLVMNPHITRLKLGIRSQSDCFCPPLTLHCRPSQSQERFTCVHRTLAQLGIYFPFVQNLVKYLEIYWSQDDGWCVNCVPDTWTTQHLFPCFHTLKSDPLV